MVHKALALTLGLIVAVSPLAATQPDPAVIAAAPPGTADTRYCLRVGPITGQLAETVQCWTRVEWAEQGVDVDKEWTEEGVRVIA